MIVTYTLKRGTPLTPEQIAEIEEAAKYPIVFDEDCPEMTEEQLRQFKRVNPLPQNRITVALSRLRGGGLFVLAIVGGLC